MVQGQRNEKAQQKKTLVREREVSPKIVSLKRKWRKKNATGIRYRNINRSSWWSSTSSSLSLQRKRKRDFPKFFKALFFKYLMKPTWQVMWQKKNILIRPLTTSYFSIYHLAAELFWHNIKRLETQLINLKC